MCTFLISQISFAWNIDKKIEQDDSKFCASHYDMPKYAIVGLIGLAAYEGTESRLGLVAWKSIDAGLMSQVITDGLKLSTGRVRPRDTDSSSEWGKEETVLLVDMYLV